jgi:fatty-acyl-CoA synthase
MKGTAGTAGMDVDAGSVIEAVLGWAERAPDRFAVGFRGASGWEPPLSFGALGRAIFGAAHALAGAGVGPGDRVVLAVDSNLPAVAGFFGALALGAVPVLVAPWAGGLGSGPFYVKKLSHEAGLVDARLVVVPSAMAAHLAEVGRPLLGEDELRRDADSPPRTIAATEDQLCTLQLTSGSTGFPRAVEVTNRNAIANAEALCANNRNRETEVTVVWLPLFHDMGLQGGLLSQVLYGNGSYFIPPAQFVRDPGVMLDAIARFRPSFIAGPNFSYPLMARALEKRAPDPEMLSSIRCCYNGAEPIQAASVERFLEAAAPFGFSPGAMIPCFGLGEATLVVSATRPGDGLVVDVVDRALLASGVARPVQPGGIAAPMVSCGPPVRHMQVEILDEEGRAVEERRLGEITCRGPSVSPGYFGDDEATRASFRDGRILTGDLGYMANGQLHVVGRRKDVLVVHGQKYPPQAVEWAAESVEGVRRGRAAAFSVPDPDKGTEEVIVACESNLPAEQHPDMLWRVVTRVLEETGLRVKAHVFPAGIVPKTSSGKIKRQDARAMFLDWMSSQPRPDR